MSYVALDTSVLAEYIDLKGDYHDEAEVAIKSALTGDLTMIIPHIVLAEFYYVLYRIYEKLKLKNPSARSEKIVEWLYKSPNLTIAESSFELAVRSGRIKKEFSLALPDSYVIAAAKLYRGKALFKRREKEMARNLTTLAKEYEIVFLDEYKF